MITILQRHIARTVISATGLVAVIITGVMFLTSLLGELKDIGEGYYSIDQVIYYVLLRLPNEIYRFSPLLILIGCIIGLSTLSSNRELAVMRASGFSIRRIILNVFSAAMLMIIAIGVLGETIAPNLSYKAEVRKENLRSSGQALVTSRGIWFHLDNNFIHVEHVIGRQLLEGVTRYEFDKHRRLQTSYYAKKLAMVGRQWVMSDVVTTSFHKDRTKSKTMAEAPWNLKLNQNLLKVGLADPNEMTLVKLTQFAEYLEKNGLQASQYRYEFWLRIFQPLASLVMIFLAIPFVLGTLSTSTTGWRIIIGIMTGFAFFISNALLGQVCIVFQLPAVFAASLPVMAFALFGVFLSKKVARG